MALSQILSPSRLFKPTQLDPYYLVSLEEKTNVVPLCVRKAIFNLCFYFDKFYSNPFTSQGLRYCWKERTTCIKETQLAPKPFAPIAIRATFVALLVFATGFYALPLLAMMFATKCGWRAWCEAGAKPANCFYESIQGSFSRMFLVEGTVYLESDSYPKKYHQLQPENPSLTPVEHFVPPSERIVGPDKMVYESKGSTIQAYGPITWTFPSVNNASTSLRPLALVSNRLYVEEIKYPLGQRNLIIVNVLSGTQENNPYPYFFSITIAPDGLCYYIDENYRVHKIDPNKASDEIVYARKQGEFLHSHLYLAPNGSILGFVTGDTNLRILIQPGVEPITIPQKTPLPLSLSSPCIVTSNEIIYGHENNLYSLSCDGQLKWQRDIEKKVSFLTANSTAIYAVVEPNTVLTINPRDGSTIRTNILAKKIRTDIAAAGRRQDNPIILGPDRAYVLTENSLELFPLEQS